MKIYYKGKCYIVRVSRIHGGSLILCTCDGEEREYSKQQELVIIRGRLNYRKDYKKERYFINKARYRLYRRLDKNHDKLYKPAKDL